MAISQDTKDIWTAAGLVLGFQVTFLKWRLEREVKKGDDGDLVWLAPSDYLGIFGLLTLVIGCYLVPVGISTSSDTAAPSLGVGALLFVGQALGLCGHYELFTRTPRTHRWLPAQEQGVLVLMLVVLGTYLWILGSYP